MCVCVSVCFCGFMCKGFFLCLFVYRVANDGDEEFTMLVVY